MALTAFIHIYMTRVPAYMKGKTRYEAGSLCMERDSIYRRWWNDCGKTFPQESDNEFPPGEKSLFRRSCTKHK